MASKNNKAPVLKQKKVIVTPQKTKAVAPKPLAVKSDIAARHKVEELAQDVFAFNPLASSSNEHHGHKKPKSDKSAFVGDIHKTVDYLANSNVHFLNTSVTAANAATNLTEQLLHSSANTLSQSMEQNVTMTQDLLKCKDLVDTIGAQQKFLQANFTNALNFMLGISDSTKQYAFTNIDLSVSCMNQNLQGLTK